MNNRTMSSNRSHQWMIHYITWTCVMNWVSDLNMMTRHSCYSQSWIRIQAGKHNWPQGESTIMGLSSRLLGDHIHHISANFSSTDDTASLSQLQKTQLCCYFSYAELGKRKNSKYREIISKCNIMFCTLYHHATYTQISLNNSGISMVLSCSLLGVI
jgi:hypothetical protein